MATPKPTHAPPRTPWYARTATAAGRPLVLAATLVMSMPGEYHVARFAGWSDPWAYGMPFSLSSYAGIAAVVAATRPRGARGRASATIGAALAITLALAAQVVAHLSATGHMDHDQAWLIAVTSTVPPAVLAHLLHLAATPVVTIPDAAPPAIPPLPATPPTPVVTAPVSVGTAAVTIPDAAATPAYSDDRCTIIRALYDAGTRPSTSSMRAALVAAGHRPPADSIIRGQLRALIETREPHLAALPPETLPLRRTAP